MLVISSAHVDSSSLSSSQGLDSPWPEGIPSGREEPPGSLKVPDSVRLRFSTPANSPSQPRSHDDRPPHSPFLKWKSGPDLTFATLCSLRLDCQVKLAKPPRSDESNKATTCPKQRRGATPTRAPQHPDWRYCTPCSDPMQQLPVAREADPDSDNSAPTPFCNTLSRTRPPAITSRVGKACDASGPQLRRNGRKETNAGSSSHC